MEMVNVKKTGSVLSCLIMGEMCRNVACGILWRLYHGNVLFAFSLFLTFKSVLKLSYNIMVSGITVCNYNLLVTDSFRNSGILKIIMISV